MNKENTKKPGDITPNDDLRDVTWEAELNATLRNSLKRHAALNYVLAVAVIALTIALAVLMPLKQLVPYVVRVDNLTGATSIGQTVQDYVAESELADKHWVNKFVVARERYNYHLIQDDYDTVKSLAGDTPWKQYNELFSGPQALDQQFGKNILITPKIVSISLTETGGQKFARCVCRFSNVTCVQNPSYVQSIKLPRFAMNMNHVCSLANRLRLITRLVSLSWAIKPTTNSQGASNEKNRDCIGPGSASHRSGIGF